MKNWLLWLIAGLLSLIGGVLALLNPLSASVAATTLAGWTLLIVGLVQGYTTWKSEGVRVRLGTGLIAAAAFIMGILLLFGPFGDGSFLRIMLALMLLVSGAAKLWAAREIRTDSLFGGVIAAGAVSVCLGLVVLSGIPGFLAGNLGVVLGLELLAGGVTLVILSLRRRRLAPQT